MLAWILLSALLGRSSPTDVDPSLAARYFAEAKAQSDQDGGGLWGVELYGPTLFVDPVTRHLVANQADADGVLQAAGDVWVGVLPPDQTIANTAKHWAGVHWTMVQWPLPTDGAPRRRLVMHEMFHRVQDGLGLPAGNPANAHMDQQEARGLARLEWRALARALVTEGEEREFAVQDAVAFRMRRQERFPEAAAEERALEMNEGLAEYTGGVLAGRDADEHLQWMLGKLRQEEKSDSFTRSFGYAVGPAYGHLLDAAGAAWRTSLTPATDFGALLLAAYGLEPSTDLEADVELCLAEYEGEQVLAEEAARARQRERQLAAYRARFLEGPTLHLPLGANLHYSFDPNTVQVYDARRAVYPALEVTEGWGTLEVTGGAMLVRDDQGHMTRAIVPAPADPQSSPITGDGYRLALADGWALRPAGRAGDWIVERE